MREHGLASVNNETGNCALKKDFVEARASDPSTLTTIYLSTNPSLTNVQSNIHGLDF